MEYVFSCQGNQYGIIPISSGTHNEKECPTTVVLHSPLVLAIYS